MHRLAWMDVISTDLERTLAYYAGLFGWRDERLPIDHGDDYRFLRSGAVNVAGAEQVAVERGLDPVWTLMVETDDARPLIDAAVAAGATETFVLAPMLDLGRIAMLRDPWGATLGVWEPITFRPSEVPLVPGRLIGAVLASPEPTDARSYHRAVFGWADSAGSHDLDAGVPVFVEARHGAPSWTPVLRGSGLSDPLPGRVEDRSARLAGAGLRAFADPMGATFYLG